MSQEKKILAYLESGKTLTPYEGLRIFGTMRLGARCFDLKKKGYNIKSKLIEDAFSGKHYAQYWLDKDSEI